MQGVQAAQAAQAAQGVQGVQGVQRVQRVQRVQARALSSALVCVASFVRQRGSRASMARAR